MTFPETLKSERTRLSDAGEAQIQILFINAPETERGLYEGESLIPTTIVMIGMGS